MKAPASLSTALLVLASLILPQCSTPRASETQRSRLCLRSSTLKHEGYRGSSMADRTLALTFDDGPGTRTLRLSSYLRDEGIRAAFFVNGRSIASLPGGEAVVDSLVRDGHLVANHTESHRSLTGLATGSARLSSEEVVQELAATHERIAHVMPEGHWLFRPPFGDFDRGTLHVLEGSSMATYVGPIFWDIGSRMDEADGMAADWDCWQEGTDGVRVAMAQCGDLYVREIERAGKGIVLLHDPYFDELAPGQQGTVEMVEYMVPLLRERGFSFVRVDEVPEIFERLPRVKENTEPTGLASRVPASSALGHEIRDEATTRPREADGPAPPTGRTIPPSSACP